MAVKSHEAKPSAISPLYRKRVEYIPGFHDCPCYNILIPWLQRGSYITFFTLVGDISRRQVIFHVIKQIPVKYPIDFILPPYIFCRSDIQPSLVPRLSSGAGAGRLHSAMVLIYLYHVTSSVIYVIGRKVWVMVA